VKIVHDIFNYVAISVFAVSAIAAALLALRVIVGYVGSNPFLWLPYQLRRVTEPMVRPFRTPFYGRNTRFDLLPLVAAVMVLLAGWFTADLMRRVGDIVYELAVNASYGLLTGRLLAVSLVILVGTLYEAAIFLRFLLPWFGVGYSRAIMRFLFIITEPLLKPLRRLLGSFVSVSMFDFTPLIALILVRIVTVFVADIIGRSG
jgi:uncharacterized protein YggT (Ycf19 family)